jgi:hypothetical protein
LAKTNLQKEPSQRCAPKTVSLLFAVVYAQKHAKLLGKELPTTTPTKEPERANWV